MLKKKLEQNEEMKAMIAEEEVTSERIASMKKLLIQERVIEMEERRKRDNVKVDIK